MFYKKFTIRWLVSIWIFISMISISFAVFFQFSGIMGIAHIIWVFTTDNSGNAGTVSFNEPWFSAGIDGYDITGKFYIETIGEVIFSPGTRIVPPLSGNIIDLWFVSGSVDSNAGLIFLWDGTPSNTTTFYDPKTKTLVGYGTNTWIGKVSFWILSTTTLVGTGIVNASGSLWFEWRVKILGNMAGTSLFDTFYSLWSRLNIALFTQTLNKMREKVAVKTRNLSVIQMNSSFWSTSSISVNNHLFFINQSSSHKMLKYSDIKLDFENPLIDSMIIIGWDLFIDADIINSSTITGKWIIVLKNTAWVGGNIFIKDVVQKIQSSVFTEGTVYSGNSESDLYNNTPEKGNANVFCSEGDQYSVTWLNAISPNGSKMAAMALLSKSESNELVIPFTNINATHPT